MTQTCYGTQQTALTVTSSSGGTPSMCSGSSFSTPAAAAPITCYLGMHDSGGGLGMVILDPNSQVSASTYCLAVTAECIASAAPCQLLPGYYPAGPFRFYFGTSGLNSLAGYQSLLSNIRNVHLCTTDYCNDALSDNCYLSMQPYPSSLTICASCVGASNTWCGDTFTCSYNPGSCSMYYTTAQTCPTGPPVSSLTTCSTCLNGYSGANDPNVYGHTWCESNKLCYADAPSSDVCSASNAISTVTSCPTQPSPDQLQTCAACTAGGYGYKWCDVNKVCYSSSSSYDCTVSGSSLFYASAAACPASGTTLIPSYCSFHCFWQCAASSGSVFGFHPAR